MTKPGSRITVKSNLTWWVLPELAGKFVWQVHRVMRPCLPCSLVAGRTLVMGKSAGLWAYGSF